MPLTDEQQVAHDYVTSNHTLSLVDSCAGSGKTTLLVTIANTLSTEKGLYLAYNSSIAKEASRKFPKSTTCLTTHSLAYKAVVKPYKLKTDSFSFTYRNITEKISYDDKLYIVNNIRQFCLSKHLTFQDFASEFNITPHYTKLANRYLDLMETGKIDTTHEFYLKYFHILLAHGDIEYDLFDYLMLDEAGDLNEVTLEIFKLLPAARKIAVGDPFQNIYTFNHTINCFEVLKNEGTIFRMSQSFRVADYLATRVETFCQSYLDPKMVFKGVEVTDPTIHTRGYLTRTNSALIGRMIELNQQNIPYALVRNINEIFRLPLTLLNLKYQGFITDPSYKHLQVDVDEWYEVPDIRERYKSPLAYIASLHSQDFQLQQGVRLIQRYGKPSIMQAYSEAKKHQKAKQSYVLATAHSCKGLEFDEVTLADDMNESIAEILPKFSITQTPDLNRSEMESLNLYYVACTRAAKVLNNASHLKDN